MRPEILPALVEIIEAHKIGSMASDFPAPLTALSSDAA
jgi:hypothetical protein